MKNLCPTLLATVLFTTNLYSMEVEQPESSLCQDLESPVFQMYVYSTPYHNNNFESACVDFIQIKRLNKTYNALCNAPITFVPFIQNLYKTFPNCAHLDYIQFRLNSPEIIQYCGKNHQLNPISNKIVLTPFLIKQLVTEGADVNCKIRNHRNIIGTPLMYFTSNLSDQYSPENQLACIETLLELGADQNIINPSGFGALSMATSNKNLPIINLLLQHNPHPMILSRSLVKVIEHDYGNAPLQFLLFTAITKNPETKQQALTPALLSLVQYGYEDQAIEAVLKEDVNPEEAIVWLTKEIVAKFVKGDPRDERMREILELLKKYQTTTEKTVHFLLNLDALVGSLTEDYDIDNIL